MRQSSPKPGVFYQSCRRTCGEVYFFFFFISILFIRAIIWTSTGVFRAEISITNLAKGGPRGIEAGGWFHEKRCYDFDAALFNLISLSFFFWKEEAVTKKKGRGAILLFLQYITFPPKTHLLHFTSLPSYFPTLGSTALHSAIHCKHTQNSPWILHSLTLRESIPHFFFSLLSFLSFLFFRFFYLVITFGYGLPGM